MLEIKNIGADIYECKDYFRTFTVTPMEGQILLYGTVGSQAFTYKGKFCKKELILAFPDRRAATRASQYHTRGVLNKDKFRKSAVSLSEGQKIDMIKLHELLEFIETCNCSPIKAMEKLIRKGFSNIVGDLDFYEESPEMIETTQALIDFINCL